MDDIKIYTAESHEDKRGVLSFFNDLNLSPIKRTYIIEHTSNNFVRAWQGHKFEQKWFYVIKGSFKILLVKPDNWNVPSEDLKYIEFELSACENKILHVPGGFVSGFRGMESGSKMMVFSNFSLEESKADDYRFDKHLWYNW